MQLGPYRLEAPLENGPAGRIFRARAADEVECEVRLLDQAKAQVLAWATLRRRLKLLTLVDHPAVLRPLAVAIDHDPPYLAMPSPRPWPLPTDFVDAIFLGQRLADVMAAAHRVGLVVGPIGAEYLQAAADQSLRVDLTGTLRPLPPGMQPEDDVARLGKFLRRLSDSWAAGDGPELYWHALLDQMQATNPEQRPLASEVAERIVQADGARQRLGLPEAPVVAAPAEPRDAVVDLAAARTIDSLEGPTNGPPRVGHQIGRFHLLATLGEGAMGVVYRAEDMLDGAIVALKVLHANRAVTEQGRRRFLKEGRLLAQVESPFVTRMIEANTDGDCCFLAVEYVAGRNLREFLLARGKLEEAAALALSADIARGLAAAHARGIIHRDIKPDNVLLVESRGRGGASANDVPQAKVTDFGLARQIEQTNSLVVTQDGAIIGTPLYMAPEQFDGRPVDARTDVYSLGVLLFELLTGRPPFFAEQLQGLMQKHLREPAPALERLEPNISSATADLVARALAKEPSARPADAGAFLRLVERIQRGETVDFQTHPRLPEGAGRTLDYVVRCDLRASPAQLWPFVSNTERVNRAIGLPAVEYSYRDDPQLGRRRMARARVNGLSMEWEEHPFEWIEGQRMGILREFARGPFVWFLSIVDLQLSPTGGTTLVQTCRVEPRGLLGRLAAAVELGLKARRSLTRLYRRIDQTLTDRSQAMPPFDAFDVPTQLTRVRQQRLLAGLERVQARGGDAQATDLLGLYLSNAPPTELARIRPIQVARRFGVGESELIDACLLASVEGLLALRWDILCPLCRIPSDQKNTLRELRDHESCPACAIDFQTDLSAAVELVFQVHPDIRMPETGRYCAGGPAHSPHVVAQVRVAAGERFELDLALTPGQYRLRGPQLPWVVELTVVSGLEARRFDLTLAETQRPPAATLAAGSQVVTLVNNRSHDVIVRVERSAARDDALTAARATTLPRFRELFPGEVLAPGQIAQAATLTLFHGELAEGASLYQQHGDVGGFHLVQAFLRIAEEVVRAEGGTMVKSIGEGFVAVFRELTSATRAALALPAALAREPATAEVPVRASIHRGLVLVATLNDRLDYFGAAAQTAARLLDRAGADDLVLTAANASDPEVNELLRGRDLRVDDLPDSDGGRRLFFHVRLR